MSQSHVHAYFIILRTCKYKHNYTFRNKSSLECNSHRHINVRSSQRKRNETKIQLRNSRGKSKIYVHTVARNRGKTNFGMREQKKIGHPGAKSTQRCVICAIIQANLYKQRFGLLRSNTDVHQLQPYFTVVHRGIAG